MNNLFFILYISIARIYYCEGEQDEENLDLGEIFKEDDLPNTS